MDFNGDIAFSIYDMGDLDINFRTGLQPTRTAEKGNVLALGMKVPRNMWGYTLRFNSEEEFSEKLNIFVNTLLKEKTYIDELSDKYDRVSIDLYIRSDSAQIGFSLPSHIMARLAEIECEVSFHILSSGMVIDE